MAAGLYGRFAGITQGLWTDEVLTVVRYTEVGPHAIFGESSINNHVLYTFLAWCGQAVFGPSEVIYRLPSVLPDLAAIALLGVHLRRRVDRASLLAVTSLALIAPQHIAFVREARGYGLATLGIAGLLVFGERYVERRRWPDLVGFGALGFVGITAVPVLAAPFGLATAVLVLARWRQRRVWLEATGMFAVVAVASFAMLRGVVAQLDKSYGDFHNHRRILPLGLHDLGAQFGRAVAALYAPVDAVLVRVPLSPIDATARAAAVVVGTALAAVGAWVLWSTGRRVLLALCLVPTLGTVLAAVVQGLALHDRYLDFTFLPYVLLIGVGLGRCWTDRAGVLGRVAWPVLAAAALAVLAAALGDLTPRQAAGVAAAVLVLGLASSLVVGRTALAVVCLAAAVGVAGWSAVAAAHMMSVTDREASKLVADALERAGVDTVMARYATRSLAYYVDDLLLVRDVAGGQPANNVKVKAIIDWAQADELMCRGPAGVAMVENIRVRRPSVPQCFLDRGAEELRFAQRGGLVVRVWVLPAADGA